MGMCWRIPFLKHSGIGESIGTENRPVVVRDPGSHWDNFLVFVLSLSCFSLFKNKSNKEQRFFPIQTSSDAL